MPQPRFFRLDATRRSAMLAAAAEEFATHGYDRASLQRIADRLETSKGSLYYYFDGKADLFAMVADETWRVLLPDHPVTLEDLNAETFWRALRVELRAMAERTLEVPWLAGVARILYNPSHAADVHEIVDRQFERSRAWIRAAIRHGQSVGVIRSDLPEELLAAMVMAAAEAADRWTVDHWSDMRPETLVDLSDRVFGEVRFGLHITSSHGEIWPG